MLQIIALQYTYNLRNIILRLKDACIENSLLEEDKECYEASRWTTQEQLLCK